MCATARGGSRAQGCRPGAGGAAGLWRPAPGGALTSVRFWRGIRMRCTSCLALCMVQKQTPARTLSSAGCSASPPSTTWLYTRPAGGGGGGKVQLQWAGGQGAAAVQELRLLWPGSGRRLGARSRRTRGAGLRVAAVGDGEVHGVLGVPVVERLAVGAGGEADAVDAGEGVGQQQLVHRLVHPAHHVQLPAVLEPDARHAAGALAGGCWQKAAGGFDSGIDGCSSSEGSRRTRARGRAAARRSTKLHCASGQRAKSQERQAGRQKPGGQR
jgi:hypothetical protein